MPSKGVQVYTFITAPGCEVVYSVPGEELVRNELHRFYNDHLEVDKRHLSALKFSGTFSFRVKHNGQEVTSQNVQINTLTGNLEGGTMEGMTNQRAVINNEIAIAYGFYDAGSGLAGLPNSDQCYVTVTPNLGNWMGQLAPQGSREADQRFSRLVLPAAHDIGMNSMQSSEALIQQAGGPFIETLKGYLQVFAKAAAKLSTGIALNIAPNIISALAITQKDSTDAVLTLGARYFEFRPARVHGQVLQYSNLPNTFYFQHGPIPGMLYDDFLHDVVAFLVAHPLEIVVVQLRWDGVPAECGHPSDDELRQSLDRALEQSNGSIQVGNVDDMRNRTINDLRNDRKRLIVFNPVDVYSTYTDEGNATLTGDSIIQQFERLDNNQMNGKPLTNVQCQATSTNLQDVIIHSVLASNVTTSPLLATKPICDSKTLPWLRQHLLEKLTGDGLITIMNDFFDGATAEVAIGLSRQRLG